MRRGVGVVMAVALVGVVVVAAPAGAIDRARAEAMKEEARAATVGMQPTESVSSTKALKTVVVRCDKGQSVQAALDANSGPVVIEIQGICTENVRIERRSDVTLRGKRSDPSQDGLSGPADPTRYATLEIRYASRLVLQDLSFDGGTRGVALWYSDGEISNCDFNDNSVGGLYVGVVSQVRARDVEASRNGSWGIRVYRHGWLSCQSCDLVGNAPVSRWDRSAVLADNGGFATFWDSVVSGTRGLVAWGDDSYVDIDCLYGDPAATHECSLNASVRAGHAQDRGTVGFLSVPITGNLSAGHGSLVVMGANQLQGTVGLTGSSELSVSGGWDKQDNETEARLGPTTLYGWTRATFDYGTVIENPVQCFDAADALVDGSVVPGSFITGCPHVP